MNRTIFSIFSAMILTGSLFLAACGGDSQDQPQAQQSQQALQNLDAENQKNRANQTLPNVPPQITIISPSTGSSVSASPLAVSWTATDQNNDKLGVEVQYRVVADTMGAYQSVMPFTTPDPKNFSWNINSLSAGDYELMVKVSDGSLSNVAFSRIKK
ncbi:MAG: Ig-like domain-containing protein [Nanoarchaeota archaeon]|mgnify:CR=1 FL=1